MQVMVKQPKAGEWYPVQPVWGGYALPPELRPGDEVTVLRREHGYYLVKDRTDREFRLFSLCVKTGELFDVKGRWFEADHPAVAAERDREKAADSYRR
jgi:hypothetical protein